MTPTSRTRRRVGVGLPIFSPESVRPNQWWVGQHCLPGGAVTGVQHTFEWITIMAALIGSLWQRLVSRNRRVLVSVDKWVRSPDGEEGLSVETRRIQNGWGTCCVKKGVVLFFDRNVSRIIFSLARQSYRLWSIRSPVDLHKVKSLIFLLLFIRSATPNEPIIIPIWHCQAPRAPFMNGH
jgi:hypothetical protein